ncbi:MAG: acyl-CoA thioesterase II [Microbacteriaceae bacterium]
MLDALDLSDDETRTQDDVFIGKSLWMPQGRIFGGQVLAQSLMAAIKTMPDDRSVHSMHAYFLRPGNIDKSITFAVERIHDGRSFSTRRTEAFQDGKPILSMIASFQTEDRGLDHQIDMPEGIPLPEDLPNDSEQLGDINHPVAEYWASKRPFEMRHIDKPVYLKVEGERVAHQAVWLKTVDAMPDDPNIHRAALAYASDYTILEPVLRRHGIAWATPGLKGASLDHAMWWHRFARVDQWLLYLQESPSATGGRGLSTGKIYTKDGILIATVAQEGMIRIPEHE